MIIKKGTKSDLAEGAYLGLADSYFLEKKYSEAEKAYRKIPVLFKSTNMTEIINSRLKDIGKKDVKPSKKYSAYYTVQIGSFSKKSNATALYRKFKRRKYSANMSRYKKNGKTFYKVRIGKFKSEKKANEFAKKLKRQGHETKVTPW